MGTSPPPTSSSTNSMATSDSRTGGLAGPFEASPVNVASETRVGTIPSGLCFMSSGALKWYQFSCSVCSDSSVALRFSQPSDSHVRWDE